MTAAPRRLPGAALLAAVVAAGAVVAALAGGLARHGALLVHQCVPADPAVGRLGVSLALLRPEADCPTGTLAVGGDGTHVMGVVVLVALPVLLTHLLALGTGLGLVARLRVLVRATAAVLGWVASPVPAAPALVVRRVRAAVVAARRLPSGRPALAVPLRRGPPVLGFA